MTGFYLVNREPVTESFDRWTDGLAVIQLGDRYQ